MSAVEIERAAALENYIDALKELKARQERAVEARNTVARYHTRLQALAPEVSFTNAHHDF
jgi:hypothetical protein